MSCLPLPQQPQGSAFLRREHVLGLRSDLPDSVRYLSKDELLYPCGNVVVIQDINTREQRFVELSRGQDELTALAVSPNRKLIAVAGKKTKKEGEGGEVSGEKEKAIDRGTDIGELDFAIVSVCDVFPSASRKRRRVLRPKDDLSDIFCVSFGPDSKSLLLLGWALAGSDYILSYWSIDGPEIKAEAMMKLITPLGKDIYRADVAHFGRNENCIGFSSSSLSQSNQAVACVTGDTVLRFFRIVDGAFRPVTVTYATRNVQQPDFTSQRWLSCGRVALGTGGGQLLLVENFEVREVPPPAPELWGGDKERGAIRSIVEYSKGIVLGRDSGVVQLYTRIEDSRRVFSPSRQLVINRADTSPVVDLAISPQGDSVVCVMSHGNMRSLPLLSSDFFDSEGKGSTFDDMLPSFHCPGLCGASKVTSIDVCLWRPIVAFSGEDGTVKVWNYYDRSIELVHRFESEVLVISLHPSGLCVLVCTAEAVLCCAILSDQLKTLWQRRRKTSTRVCDFANGGHCFALACRAFVQVYDSYTFEEICSLRGHSEAVIALRWKSNDREICTIGADGVVCVWNMPTGKKLKRCVNSLSTYTSGVANDDLTIAFVSTESALEKVEINHDSNASYAKVCLPMDRILLSRSSQLLIGCTAVASGSVFVRTFPADTNNETPNLINSHRKGITCMALSADESFLFTASEDGTLGMFRVHNPLTKGLSKSKNVQKLDWLSEEMLVSQKELDEKARGLALLREQMEESQSSSKKTIESASAENESLFDSMLRKNDGVIADSKGRYENTNERKRNVQGMFEEEIDGIMENQRKELSIMQSIFGEKLASVIRRNEKLGKERNDFTAQWDQEQENLVDQQMKELERLTKKFHEEIRKEALAYKNLAAEKKKLQTGYKEFEQDVNVDSEEEISCMMQEFEKKIAAEKISVQRMQEENGIHKKKHAYQLKELDEQKDTLELKEKEVEIREGIESLDKCAHKHRESLRRFDEVIHEKEKKIQMYESENRELEDCRLTLVDDIRQLKRDLQPKEEKVSRLQSELVSLDFDFEKCSKENRSLKDLVSRLEGKLEGLKQTYSARNRTMEEKAEFIKKLEQDLRGVGCAADRDTQALKGSLFPLFRKYLREDATRTLVLAECKSEGCESESESELRRRILHLEKNIRTLENAMKTKSRLHKADISRLGREKSVLEASLVELEKDAKYLADQQDSIRAQRLDFGSIPGLD